MAAAVVAALALASCGQQQTSQTEANASAASQTYSGTGTVTTVARDQVTISHGPIQGIDWPAMTMTFTATDRVAGAVRAGDPVVFSFRKAGSVYQLTSLQKR